MDALEKRIVEIVEKYEDKETQTCSFQTDLFKEILRSSLTLAYNEGVEDSIKEVPEEEPLPKGKCMNLENHLFGSCFQCEKIKGQNYTRSLTLERLEGLKL